MRRLEHRRVEGLAQSCTQSRFPPSTVPPGRPCPQPQIPRPVSNLQEACAVPQPAAHVCPLNRALLRAHGAIAGSGISKPFLGPSDFRGGPSERGFAGWPLLQEGSWHSGLLFPGLAASEAPPVACRGLFSSASPVPCLGVSRTMETRGPHAGRGHATRSHNGPLSPSEEAALCPE